MDNRTIEEVRENENKLIDEIKKLEEQLEYKEKVIKKATECILDCLLNEKYINLDGEYIADVFSELTRILNVDKHNKRHE